MQPKHEINGTQQSLRKTYEAPELITHGTSDEITKVLRIQHEGQMMNIGATCSCVNIDN